MQEATQEYFNNYFGGTLNESTTDEEIIEAVYDLVALRDAVLEATGLTKNLLRSYINKAADDKADARSHGDHLDAEGYGKDLEKRKAVIRHRESKRTKGIDKASGKLAGVQNTPKRSAEGDKNFEKQRLDNKYKG